MAHQDSGAQPFSPDDVYCVYCHAPAAGFCAGCRALCCSDCVELVMGVTTQRAVCRSCLEHGRLPTGIRAFFKAGVAIAALIGAVLLLLVYVSR